MNSFFTKDEADKIIALISELEDVDDNQYILNGNSAEFKLCKGIYLEKINKDTFTIIDGESVIERNNIEEVIEYVKNEYNRRSI